MSGPKRHGLDRDAGLSEAEAAFGIQFVEAAIEGEDEPEDDGCVEVWEENVDSLQAFMRCGSYWSTIILEQANKTITTGLRLADVQVLVWAYHGDGERARGIMRDLIYMAEVALPLLNK